MCATIVRRYTTCRSIGDVLWCPCRQICYQICRSFRQIPFFEMTETVFEMGTKIKYVGNRQICQILTYLKYVPISITVSVISINSKMTSIFNTSFQQYVALILLLHEDNFYICFIFYILCSIHLSVGE